MNRGPFKSKLFRYPGKGGWVFAPIPKKHAPPVTRPWGRTPVVATVDGREWTTSAPANPSEPSPRDFRKSLIVPHILLLALLLSQTSLSSSPAAQSPHPVEQFFMSGIAAFNEHDLDRFMKQFAPDIEMYTPTGWLRGQQNVRDRFAQTFKQFPSVQMTVENLRVREVAPGMVVTDFTWRVHPMGKGPAFHGVGSGVYVLRNGAWVEVLEHETVLKVDEGLGAPKK